MASQPTLKERLSYWFDNYMSRGTLALIGGLGVISLVLILVIAAVVSIGGPHWGQKEPKNYPLWRLPGKV